MKFALMAAAGLATGSLAILQGALNARISAAIGTATMASLVNFVVGAVFLLAVCLLSRTFSLTNINASTAPWWGWLAGCIGALFVLSTTWLIPKIGTVNVVALLVAGQVMAGLVFDHFGFLGVPKQAISLPRLAGCAFVIIGVILARR